MSESGISRPEVIAIVVKATLVGLISYFGLKWTIDAIDPTRMAKKEAKEKVSSNCSFIIHCNVHFWSQFDIM